MNDIDRTSNIILSSVKDGVLPLPIFNAFSQVAVLSPVDLYAFVQVAGELNVIVSKRPENDEFLSGQWHIPGKIMITTDKSFSDTISRTMASELPGSTHISKPVQFSCDYQSTPRGKEHVESYWAIIDKVPTVTDGEEVLAVDIENLPEPFLVEQIERIYRANKAAKAYIASNN